MNDLREPTTSLRCSEVAQGRHKHYSPRWHQRGLTLIEITITLTIIGLMAGMAMVSIQALGGSYLRSTSFGIAGAIKESYDRAIMEKRTQRITFDLENHVWWAEFTEDPYALADEDSEEDLDLDLDEDTSADIRAALEGGRAAAFKTDPHFGKKKNELPGDVHFGRAWTGMRKDAFEKGLVHIHFFRGGFTEPLQLEVYEGPENGRKEDREWMTIKVLPLTGRARIYSKKLETPEIKRPWEEDR